MKELNLYLPEKSISHDINQRRDKNRSHANGLTSHQDTTSLEFSVPSRSPAGREQVEPWQRQRASGRRARWALVAGLTGLSLLGAEFMLPSSLTSRKLREYIGNTVSRDQGVLPQSSGVRELPILPHSPGVREPSLSLQSPGVRELPHRVQWVQTTVSYQFLTRKPLTISLPQLQRTPETLPVKVTLDAPDSLPRWLNFDADKLALSGTAPSQEKGKTYYLTFRAHAADGLESLLHSFLTIR
jgi:hypothetical protein